MDPTLERIVQVERLAHLDLDAAERRLLAERLERLLAAVAVLESSGVGPERALGGACPRREDEPADPNGGDPLAGALRDDEGFVLSPPPGGRCPGHD